MRLRRGAVRWGLAFLLALAVAFVPLPGHLPDWVSYVQVSLGAFLAVCLVGKLLYDTLFYDRYRP